MNVNHFLLQASCQTLNLGRRNRLGGGGGGGVGGVNSKERVRDECEPFSPQKA